MENYGPFIRELRIAQGSLQKDFYDGLIVKSFAIRFEKGEVMLQFDTFIKVLERLNLTVTEFLNLIEKKSNTKEALSELFIRGVRTNNERLVERVANLGKDKLNKDDKMLVLLAKAWLAYNPSHIQKQRAIDDSERQLVFDYLINRPTWLLFHIEILSLTTHLFNGEQIDQLINKAFQQLHHYEKMAGYTQLLVDLISNYIMLSYEEGALQIGNQWFVKLQSIAIPKSQIYLQLVVQVCEVFYLYNTGKTGASEKLFADCQSVLSGLDYQKELRDINVSFKRFKKIVGSKEFK
ncbi:hypothetical protein G7081_05475 [Vagococcus coleopterorum]|uniref:HTH-type transcriptional regulator Rgg C-terminal domain-containing protein n=1 Tax=Vagococcus coleopterorum TaxID=2714946 RepID=A0A6G8ANP4_9ENTE|nr:hypothetical protein [Vagococcus coleopterorum]QIL46562.1 hypothetical protein G7081_05475 [Vagococcus coleopterorum]